MFEKWPYTNFHDLNLDWIIDKVKNIDDNVSAAQSSAESAADSAEAAAGSAEASAGSAADAAESAAELPAAVAQLSARLDNLIVDGTPTEGNTELIDIRVGADGVTYHTAGDAVRGQFTVSQKTRGAYINVTSSLYVTYNVTTRELVIPPQFSVYRGVGRANNGYTIDCSSFGGICILLMKSDYSIYATNWQNGTIQDNTDEVVGFVNGSDVWINGVNPRQIGVKTNTSGGVPYFVNGLHNSPCYLSFPKSAYVVYDTSTKQLTIPAGFTINNGRGYIRNQQTIDLSEIITSSNPAAILYIHDANVYAKTWLGCFADTYTDQAIGYIYDSNVVIAGVSSENLAVRSSADNVYCFGDSITAGVGSTLLYHMYWHRWNPALRFYNWGVGSTGFVTTTSDNVLVGGGVEGRGSAKTESGNNNVLNVMQSVSAAMPNIAIFAGTNDYGSAIDAETFRTSVQNTLDYALTKTNNVAVITPVRRNGGGVNAAGLTLKDYCDIIESECVNRGISCCSGYDVSINPNNAVNREAVAPDGLHPNAAGHARIARACFDKMLEAFNK